MNHPWFAPVDWHAHAHSAGLASGQAPQPSPPLQHSPPSRPAGTAPPPVVGHLSLAGGGHPNDGSINMRNGSGNGSIGSEPARPRSVHSMGMASEQSAASTNLAELGADGGETTSHIDNLIGLNMNENSKV